MCVYAHTNYYDQHENINKIHLTIHKTNASKNMDDIKDKNIRKTKERKCLHFKTFREDYVIFLHVFSY